MIAQHISVVWPELVLIHPATYPWSARHGQSFLLVRTLPHGIARRKGLIENHRPHC